MIAAITRHPLAEAEKRTPVDSFSDCHAGILSLLRSFSSLPPFLDAARRARDIAQRTVKIMDKAAVEHHKEEEEVLFPAVLRSAEPGAEHDNVQSLIWRLTDEHREIEAMWNRVRPEVVRAAAGRPAQLQQEMVNVLVTAYRHHAQVEEAYFLPLAQEILGRNDNHMAALGLSLHLRSATVPIGYL